MKSKFKIIVPEPCSENWDKMVPMENGRFCLSCSKTVVDFTSMLPEEVQHFFIQNKNKNICGRFKQTQLDEIIITIPNQVLYSQTNYHKIFLLALFIVMGTTLFSCADKNGSKQKIDKIEVVSDTSKIEKIYVGEYPAMGNDTMHLPPPSSPKKDQVKFVKPSIISCGETTAKDSIVEDETIVMGAAIETKAEYPNGIDAFYQFITQEINLPETVEKKPNQIVIKFIVERDGSLSSFEYPKNTDPLIEAEITRVLKQSPKWVAGTQNGKKIKIKYSLPISFQ